MLMLQLMLETSANEWISALPGWVKITFIASITVILAVIFAAVIAKTVFSAGANAAAAPVEIHSSLTGALVGEIIGSATAVSAVAIPVFWKVVIIASAIAIALIAGGSVAAGLGGAGIDIGDQPKAACSFSPSEIETILLGQNTFTKWTATKEGGGGPPRKNIGMVLTMDGKESSIYSDQAFKWASYEDGKDASCTFYGYVNEAAAGYGLLSGDGTGSKANNALSGGCNKDQWRELLYPKTPIYGQGKLMSEYVSDNVVGRKDYADKKLWLRPIAAGDYTFTLTPHLNRGVDLSEPGYNKFEVYGNSCKATLKVIAPKCTLKTSNTKTSSANGATLTYAWTTTSSSGASNFDPPSAAWIYWRRGSEINWKSYSYDDFKAHRGCLSKARSATPSMGSNTDPEPNSSSGTGQFYEPHQDSCDQGLVKDETAIIPTSSSGSSGGKTTQADGDAGRFFVKLGSSEATSFRKYRYPVGASSGSNSEKYYYQMVVVTRPDPEKAIAPKQTKLLMNPEADASSSNKADGKAAYSDYIACGDSVMVQVNRDDTSSSLDITASATSSSGGTVSQVSSIGKNQKANMNWTIARASKVVKGVIEVYEADGDGSTVTKRSTRLKSYTLDLSSVDKTTSGTSTLYTYTGTTALPSADVANLWTSATGVTATTSSSGSATSSSGSSMGQVGREVHLVFVLKAQPEADSEGNAQDLVESARAALTIKQSTLTCTISLSTYTLNATAQANGTATAVEVKVNDISSNATVGQFGQTVFANSGQMTLTDSELTSGKAPYGGTTALVRNVQIYAPTNITLLLWDDTTPGGVVACSTRISSDSSSTVSNTAD